VVAIVGVGELLGAGAVVTGEDGVVVVLVGTAALLVVAIADV
jgi:hypothetical protein